MPNMMLQNILINYLPIKDLCDIVLNYYNINICSYYFYSKNYCKMIYCPNHIDYYPTLCKLHFKLFDPKQKLHNKKTIRCDVHECKNNIKFNTKSVVLKKYFEFRSCENCYKKLHGQKKIRCNIHVHAHSIKINTKPTLSKQYLEFQLCVNCNKKIGSKPIESCYECGHHSWIRTDYFGELKWLCIYCLQQKRSHAKYRIY
jgi:hypothetical protein